MIFYEESAIYSCITTKPITNYLSNVTYDHINHKNWSFVLNVRCCKAWGHCVILIECTYVIRYRGISRKSNMWHFQFFIWLQSSLGEVHFAENPTWIEPVVPKLQQLKDSQNNRKYKKCISFSGCISQSMLPLPTDPARSQHMLCNPIKAF